MTLAQALVAARPDDVSQESMAQACDVSQATISSWESGTTRPRYERLRVVARSYRIPLEKLRALWVADTERAAA